jgi:formamidopyrimidine-DNA glycosylase
MPELPEVEVTRRYLLSEGIVGNCFADVKLTWPKAVVQPSPGEFVARLKGRCIRDLVRKGKFLLFELDNEQTLIMHLRMTGWLGLIHKNSVVSPMVRTIFVLGSGTELRFRDPRKFGKLWLVNDKDLVVGKLGLEPLGSDFTPDALWSAFSGHTAPVKVLLLAQELVAGIGNIYADEILWAAGIHPLYPSSELTERDCEKLWVCIREVLEHAIKRLQAQMPLEMLSKDDNRGSGVMRFYRHEGASCPRCGSQLQRLVVRGRGTIFCHFCQG